MIQIGGLIVFESESFLYIWIENRGASLELSRRGTWNLLGCLLTVMV
jgi:hypothetical protein